MNVVYEFLQHDWNDCGVWMKIWTENFGFFFLTLSVVSLNLAESITNQIADDV